MKYNYQVVFFDDKGYIVTYTNCNTQQEVEVEVLKFLQKIELHWKIEVKKWK